MNKTRIFSWLASYPEQIPVLNFLCIVHRNRFEAKAKGRSAGIEDRNSHYRKGVSGDWQNHFDKKLKTAFKDKYGEMLIKMKYTESMDW